MVQNKSQWTRKVSCMNLVYILYIYILEFAILYKVVLEREMADQTGSVSDMPR